MPTSGGLSGGARTATALKAEPVVGTREPGGGFQVRAF